MSNPGGLNEAYASPPLNVLCICFGDIMLMLILQSYLYFGPIVG